MECFQLAGNNESIIQALDKETDVQTSITNTHANCLRNIVCKSTIAKYFEGFQHLRLE